MERKLVVLLSILKKVIECSKKKMMNKHAFIHFISFNETPSALGPTLLSEHRDDWVCKVRPFVGFKNIATK